MFPVIVVVLAMLWSQPAPVATHHLIYLHGRIVQEQQAARPLHPEHGHYELAEIVSAFEKRGFVVSAEIRPKKMTVDEAAEAVVARIRALRARGVPADSITVVGASMGAAIALRAAARLGDDQARFALLGPCLSQNVPAVTAEVGKAPAGRILVVRDESDVPASKCPPWRGSQHPGLDAQEVVIDTGLGHGFLYRPLPDWMEPVVRWAKGEKLRTLSRP